MIKDPPTQQPEVAHSLGMSSHIWTRNFILLCLANFVLFMGTQMLFPSLPGYLLEIGGQQKDIGYMMGAYTIGAMIMRPIAGWLVDSYGRKLIMISGMVLMIAASLLYNLAGDVASMTLLRSLHGLAFGLVSTAIGTIVVDSLPIGRLSEGMGYFGLTSSLSMTASPAVGFWLIGKSGYPLLFSAVSILAVLAFSASLLVKGTAAVRTSTSSATGIRAKLFEKTALLPSGIMFFLAVVYGSVLSFIALYGAERGIANVGLFFSAMALAMLLSRTTCGRWADRGSIDLVLLIGHLSLFIGMVITGFSQVITHFILAGAFIGIGFGICLPTLQALAVRDAPVNRRGAATGTFFGAMDLGIGLGTILWGFVLTVTSYQNMYFITLLPITVAGSIYFKIRTSYKAQVISRE